MFTPADRCVHYGLMSNHIRVKGVFHVRKCVVIWLGGGGVDV